MKCIYKIKWVAAIALAVFFIACNGGNEKATVMYTCPMPQDSVFSDKPGKCPKCGMDLVLMENHSMHSGHDMADSSMVITKRYTCPMHPQVQSDTAGTCPKGRRYRNGIIRLYHIRHQADRSYFLQFFRKDRKTVCEVPVSEDQQRATHHGHL